MASLMSLPKDFLLNCIARVSRLHYPTLSRVSKSFRSLLVSPELYKIRSLLGRTESCLYVCLDLFPDFYWFTLSKKPDGALTKKSSGYVLARAPIPNPPPPRCWSSNLVAVGSNIYNFTGDYLKDSPRVWILDCRTHIWREGPNLPEKLMALTASVVDEKIYVAGRCEEGNPSTLKNSVEVLDTRTQTWDPVSISCKDIQSKFCSESACIDGKVHAMTGNEKVVAYDYNKGRWDLAGLEVNHILFYSYSYCQIDNVLYSYNNGAFSWYDTRIGMAREVMGVGRLPEFSINACVKLSDYGGKMAVLWQDFLPKNKWIWCAVVALEMREYGEIWGKVEWLDHVLTVPDECDVVKVVATIV